MAREPQFRAVYYPCPHPHKVGYRMAWHALRAADHFRDKGLGHSWPYACRCGRYHLTTKGP